MCVAEADQRSTWPELNATLVLMMATRKVMEATRAKCCSSRWSQKVLDSARIGLNLRFSRRSLKAIDSFCIVGLASWQTRSIRTAQ